MAADAHSRIDLRDNSLSGARAWFARKGLTRPRGARVLAGVSASFARRYDINPLVARLLTIAGILVLTPFAYVGAWILMPNDATAAPVAAVSA